MVAGEIAVLNYGIHRGIFFILTKFNSSTVPGFSCTSAIGKGTYDATFGDKTDSRLSAMPDDIDLSVLVTPLENIDTGVQNILQSLQDKNTQSVDAESNQVPEWLSAPLANIDAPLSQILAAIPAESPMTFETVVTPLNNIATAVDNISAALGSRQPPQVNISPNISNNLGGAYVFDNAMKRELVDDITSDIVDNITSAVTRAISNSNYSYQS